MVCLNQTAPLQALHCLAAIIATGLLPALAIRPAKKSVIKKGGEPSTCIAARVFSDATLLLLLASHFLGGSKETCEKSNLIFCHVCLKLKT